MILKNILNAVAGKNSAVKNPSRAVATKPQGFLENMAFLTAGEREQLRGIGAESPAALYSAILASPESFSRMLNPITLGRLLRELDQLIPAHDKNVLEQLSFTAPPLGVIMEGTCMLAEPDFDIEERDRLFRELESLRASPSPEAIRRAKLVEAQLNALLDGRFARERATQ